MELPQYNFTPDIVIIVVIFVLIIYGLLLGREKIKTLALSVYVGMVAGEELAGPLVDLAVKRSMDLTEDVIKLSLFALPLVILEIGRRQHAKSSRKGGVIMTLVLCVLVAALAVSAGMALLSEDSRLKITSDSAIATAIYSLRLWWIAAVPLAVVAENFIRPRERE